MKAVEGHSPKIQAWQNAHISVEQIAQGKCMANQKTRSKQEQNSINQEIKTLGRNTELKIYHGSNHY